MRVVVQRSKKSKVTIDGKVNGEIDNGYVLLVGFTNGDDETIIDKMINKIVNLINRNKELFYDISCKVKDINSLHTFIDEIKSIKSVSEVERIFI